MIRTRNGQASGSSEGARGRVPEFGAGRWVTGKSDDGGSTGNEDLAIGQQSGGVPGAYSRHVSGAGKFTGGWVIEFGAAQRAANSLSANDEHLAIGEQGRGL